MGISHSLSLMMMTSQHKYLASKAESPLHSRISRSGLTMPWGGPTISFAMTVSPCGTKRDAPGRWLVGTTSWDLIDGGQRVRRLHG
eukprot:3639459-Heterocapsa_arctica.AAC.1